MFTKEFEIPDSDKVKALLPLTKEQADKKKEIDSVIKAILDGNDNRKLIILGPCSADNEEAALRYYEFLCEVALRYKDNFFIIPRIYTAKSRSLSFDYGGLISSQDAGKTVDFAKGVISARKLHIETLKRFGVSGADEIVYPELAPYIDDTVSYFVIGARCSTDTLHRQIASGLSSAVGLKNDLSGNKKILTEGLLSISTPNRFVLSSTQYLTSGNRYAHAILRGINKEDGFEPNITPTEIDSVAELLDKNGLMPSLIIDLNHGNSGKEASKQFDALEIMGNTLKYNQIKGFMIESYLYDGKGKGFGYSLTDECLGIENTKRLLDLLEEKLYGRY